MRKRRGAWVVITRATYKCNFVGPWQLSAIFDYKDEATVYARNCTKQLRSNVRRLDAKVVPWYGNREDFWADMRVSQARKAGFVT